MEDQIRQEFLSNNFTLEDDETAEKCTRLTSLLSVGGGFLSIVDEEVGS